MGHFLEFELKWAPNLLVEGGLVLGLGQFSILPIVASKNTV